MSARINSLKNDYNSLNNDLRGSNSKVMRTQVGYKIKGPGNAFFRKKDDNNIYSARGRTRADRFNFSTR